jgi:hypothetical protein
MKNCILLLALSLLCGQLPAQDRAPAEKPAADSTGVKKASVYFGTASFYAEKFNGRKTANGETYDSQKFTAACNVLPLDKRPFARKNEAGGGPELCGRRKAGIYPPRADPGKGGGIGEKTRLTCVNKYFQKFKDCSYFCPHQPND